MRAPSLIRWTWTGVWLVGACSVVWGQGAFSGPVPEIYTCVDAKGRKLTSDRWIADCADREQKILNPSGTVKRVMLPALTVLEQQQLEAKNKALQLARAQQDEGKKRDRALLVRYPNPASHQKERAAALAHQASISQASVGLILSLQSERFKLSEEMAFYEKDPGKAPPKLRARLAEVDDNLAAQKRLASEHDAALDRINARFDAEALLLRPHWPAVSP